MLQRITLITLFYLLVVSAYPQTKYPVDYFRSPIDFTPSLSGTFAEIRSGHFHSGIDYRTQSVEGKPIYAAASGFVSRIRISPGGFGKAIYIEHPNGYTTVYAHLRNFIPRIQEYIIREQYKRESFDVDLYLEPGTFRVEKGEVIAYGGNSGSSSGPHLHFEIRHTNNQNPLNPERFGLRIRDDIPPVLQALKVYPTNAYSSVEGQPQARVYELTGANGSYRIQQQGAINVAGDIAFGLQVYDMHNSSNLRNGVSVINIFIDDVQVFGYRVEEFAFSDTRYVNAVIDYEELIRTKRRFIQTRILPNNPLNIYPLIQNQGIFSFYEANQHSVRIEAEDASGNKATLRFALAANPPSATPFVSNESEQAIRFRYDQANSFQREGFYLEMPVNALYDDIWFTYREEEPANGTVAKSFFVHNEFIPVHRNYTLAIRPENIDKALRSKAVVVRKDNNGGWVSEGGTFKDGFITASTRSFGVFSLMLDTIAPVITPVNIRNQKNIAQQNDIRIKIKDNLSGIKTYRGTMNGKWILMDYDPKNELLVYEIDDRTLPGNNRFRLEVEDHTGNKTTYEATLIR